MQPPTIGLKPTVEGLTFYYIDMSVLPKNRQLVVFIRNYIRDTSKIFSISSIVIPLFFFLFFFLFFYFRNTHIYLCNKKKIDERKNKYVLIFPTYSSEKIGRFPRAGFEPMSPCILVRHVNQYTIKIRKKYVFICTKPCLRL